MSVLDRRAFLSLAALGTTAVGLAGCAPDESAPGDPRTLIVADSYPTTHTASQDGARFFMQRVSELTNGEIAFEYFSSEQLGKATDYVALTRSQAIDVGMVSPPYLSEKLPLSNVADLPGWDADACTTVTALSQLLAEDGILHEQEFAPRGLHVLFAGIVPRYEIFTRGGQELTNQSDLRGMLVRSPGGVVDQTLESLGATPVSIDGPEIYEAMARGTVDAMGIPHLSAPPYRLQEVASNATAGAPLGNFTLTFVISDATWRELPPRHQDAFAQAGAQTTRNLCAAMERDSAEARRELASGGLDFTDLTREQTAAWQKAVEPIRQQWVTDMQGLGLPGREVLTAMETALRKQSQGTK